MSDTILPRREALRRLVALSVGITLPGSLAGCREESLREPEEPVADAIEPIPGESESHRRLFSWVETLRSESLASPEVPFGEAAIRVGELAIGTPYVAFTLEEYIKAGGSPARSEPLTLDLTRFDCVSLVESCIAIARVARSPEPPTWEAFAREMERMRYRGGVRGNYATRLHYFSDWLHDNAERGLVQLLGEELGGVPDRRPLRFMSSHPDDYPALAYPEVLEEIRVMERTLDGRTRWVIPTAEISGIVDQLRTGDILAFATAIEGLDVTHAAFAYEDDDGVMRVLHAPLSGGVVEITESTVPEYVAAINRSTGILVGRPLDG